MSPTANHYNNDYLEAAQSFRSKKVSVVKVYVENWADQTFWRLYLEHVCHEKKFDVDYYRKKEQSQKGEDALLRDVKNGEIELGPNLILCLDHDFNPWLTNRLHSDVKEKNKYIIHTFWHSIESFSCHPLNLRQYHFSLTKESLCSVDYQDELGRIAEKIYPLFVLYLVAQQVAYNPQNIVYSVDEFTKDLSQIMELWPAVDSFISKQLDDLVAKIELIAPGYEADKLRIEKRLSDAGVNPKDCYVWIQGHALHHAIVFPLMKKFVDPIHHQKLENYAQQSKVDFNEYKNCTYEEVVGNKTKTLENLQRELDDSIKKCTTVFIEPAYSIIVDKIKYALGI